MSRSGSSASAATGRGVFHTDFAFVPEVVDDARELWDRIEHLVESSVRSKTDVIVDSSGTLKEGG